MLPEARGNSKEIALASLIVGQLVAQDFITLSRMDCVMDDELGTAIRLIAGLLKSSGMLDGNETPAIPFEW